MTRRFRRQRRSTRRPSSTGPDGSSRSRPPAWWWASSGIFRGISASGATRFGLRPTWPFTSAECSAAASADGSPSATLFSAGARGARRASVCILGARAPLGAWVVMWGAVAMLTSAPFDNWWHNAYGLDVKIVSPPHTLLGLGMLGINLGALLLGLSHQNRAHDALGDWLFIYIGSIFLTLGSVFVMEFSTPNLQHAAAFYEICALTFTIRIVTLAVAGRISWPATRAAAVYLVLQGLMTWILPLFPAQPKLAPIFHPVTHMVPPAFPLLLIFPAARDRYPSCASHGRAPPRSGAASLLGPRAGRGLPRPLPARAVDLLRIPAFTPAGRGGFSPATATGVTILLPVHGRKDSGTSPPELRASIPSDRHRPWPASPGRWPASAPGSGCSGAAG